MIEVEKLSKEYVRGRPALKDVSFTAGAGEVVGLLGPNGAGKTTLLRILAGVLFPTAGRARLGGHDVIEQAAKARGSLGYLPEQVPLADELRVAEYLSFRAQLKGVAAPKKAVDEVLREVGLDEPGAARRLIGELSKGFRQRVGLADALLHRPKVLLLDEPTDGLDPNQRRETLALIRRLGSALGHTVLLSTHVLPEVESICQRVVILDRGQVVAAGTAAELKARLLCRDGAAALELGCRGPLAALQSALAAVPGVSRLEVLSSTDDVHRFAIELLPKTAEASSELLARAALSVGELRTLQPLPSSLEAVFRYLTGGGQEGA
jgi:ABC-2 type transport system ATP-binding protein